VHLGHALRLVRERTGRTQQEVAALVGVVHADRAALDLWLAT
jgi:transcriptional regulator with XRE-family HTH domain